MRALQILILSDDRPGHYHLAEGVAAAIARRRPAAVRKLTIDRARFAPGRVLASLLALRMPPAAILAFGYGLSAAALGSADVVVSAGGDMLAATVAAGRMLDAETIFCGTLRHHPPTSLSLVISSYARHADQPRHLVALKPNGIDPDLLVGAEKTRGPVGGAPQRAGLLVGGNSGLFRYGPDEWTRLVAFLTAAQAATGTRWVVSTSRRSPDHVGDALQALARKPESPIVELIDFRTAGPGTLPRLFASVDAVLCTEDSSTMLSEAVCARLPVVGVSPADHNFKDEEREYRAFMQAQGWCAFMGLAELEPKTFAAALARVTPLAENHLDRLAGQLAERLPGLFH